MKAQFCSILASTCLLSTLTFFTHTTYVYVRNYTSLRFEVTMNHEYPSDHKQILNQNQLQVIAPYNTSEQKNMVLEINRALPKGEHLFTIELKNGPHTLLLKQKCISTNACLTSELGISLASNYGQDPWYMNNQAKEKHEHVLSINGHTIVVIYYAYDNNDSEDIKYLLYEKPPMDTETEKRIHINSKALAHHLTLPIKPDTHDSRPTSTNLLPYILYSFNNIRTAHIYTQMLQEIRQDTQTSSESCTLPVVYTQETSPNPEEELATLSYLERNSERQLSCSIPYSSFTEEELTRCIAQKGAWLPRLSSQEFSKTQYCTSHNKTLAAITSLASLNATNNC